MDRKKNPEFFENNKELMGSSVSELLVHMHSKICIAIKFANLTQIKWNQINKANKFSVFLHSTYKKSELLFATVLCKRVDIFRS